MVGAACVGSVVVGEAGDMTANSRGLSIYGYPQCPFCGRVLRAMSDLGLNIELRNTIENFDHQRDLIEAMGRPTVPVLRIEGEDGSVEWLPESVDIIRYLEGLVAD